MTTKPPVLFYVYEHWRPDLDVCFYVGKGHGNRSKDFRRGRNKHHKGISKKLTALGMCIEVRLVASGLSEQDAFRIEIERIQFWRTSGIQLANKTDGGEGLSNPSPELRLRLADACRKTHKGRVHSDQEKRNRTIAITAAINHPDVLLKKKEMMTAVWADPEKRKRILKGMKISNNTEEVFARRSAGQRGNKNNLGKTHSAETKSKMRVVQLERFAKKPVSENTRARMSAGQKRRFAKAKQQEIIG